MAIISSTNEPDIVKEFAGLFITTAIKKLLTMHRTPSSSYS